MPTIAFLGLGAMGTRMAARLLDAGYDLVVYNRTPERTTSLVERGATHAATPREAVRHADLILSMVRDDRASRAVWLDQTSGALGALQPDSAAVEMSTLSARWVRELNAALVERGIPFLDAPVVGSRPHAENGALTILVGGETDTLDRVRDVFGVLGGVLHHVGSVGAGTAAKLAVNALFATQAAALAEVLGTLSRSGIGAGDAVDLLNALPIMSPAAARLGTLMAERQFTPNFPVELVNKDLGYALQLADAADVRGTVLPAVREAFELADAHGFGDDDIAGIAQLYT